jgi:hypothetical protein
MIPTFRTMRRQTLDTSQCARAPPRRGARYAILAALALSPADADVERLDRVRAADHAPDLDVVIQERYELALEWARFDGQLDLPGFSGVVFLESSGV